MSSTLPQGSHPGAKPLANADGFTLPWAAFFELTKPRLSFLSVITALVGYLATRETVNLPQLLGLVIGTSLAAGSAATLNMWWERAVDARMARTRARPLPSGMVKPQHALAFGLVLGGVGIGLLAWSTNALAAVLTLTIIVLYVLAYTPLKPISRWNTLIGAVPGAMPPLVGAAAATGQIDAMGWYLFGMIFCWQMPHFMAIAWTYRRDYAEGQLKMSTVVDATGDDAAQQSVIFALLLIVVSFLPVITGQLSGWFYAPVALGLGIWYAARSVGFARSANRDANARRLFLASIIYLPVILSVLVLDPWLLGT
ncbi:MAG: heme o synthase [Verrucomicrobiota bacterium]